MGSRLLVITINNFSVKDFNGKENVLLSRDALFGTMDDTMKQMEQAREKKRRQRVERRY